MFYAMWNEIYFDNGRCATDPIVPWCMAHCALALFQTELYKS